MSGIMSLSLIIERSTCEELDIGLISSVLLSLDCGRLLSLTVPPMLLKALNVEVLKP